ncbi:hypothetical protein GSI_05092 [Ganoderma sinense ZZ0214-1]|uniref:Uncharacterized protein n=1 Tax=Ganoderma sinense ZZ0214-1 TaxID=1077348 RepID=A0A2G8SGS3_9APHY|nr:hypothetical protein GSI_05092 [Ganoderma sinense ZZ0214-1]
MSDHANTLSPLLVAWSSLHKVMKEENVVIEKAPSGRPAPPNLERDLLTFLAAVCNLHPDSDGVAIAASSADTTTLYVATGRKLSPALRQAFVRFVHDLRAAYRDHRHHPAADACENDVVLAVYRFAYPILRQFLWDDSNLPKILASLKTEPVRSLMEEALKKLKATTKDAGDQDIAPDVLRNMHELCGTIKLLAFEAEDIEHGSPEHYLLCDITGAFFVVTHFRFAPIVSGACLFDDEVSSLMAAGSPTHEWSVRWIDPVSPRAAFEAALSASAVAAWLGEYSRTSQFLPWTAAIAKITACCPKGLTKTGTRYTATPSRSPDSPLEPAETIQYCEITLLLWLIKHHVPMDKHIGCSGGRACWLCVEFAKALGTTDPDPDGRYAGVAFSDITDPDRGSVEVPWVLPADAPDAAVEVLRDAIVTQFRKDAAEYVSRNHEQDAIGLEGYLEWYNANR